VRGRARAPSRTRAARRGARRWGAALLGGRRAHECPASQGQAARREGTRPGGTKYTRGYITSSGRGDGFSPTGDAARAGGRVAAAAGIFAAGYTAPGALVTVLVAVDLGAGPGHAASAAARVRRGVVEPAAGARRLAGGAGS
jgi:hypothetical protein